jgi:hypothetical protein
MMAGRDSDKFLSLLTASVFVNSQIDTSFLILFVFSMDPLISFTSIPPTGFVVIRSGKYLMKYKEK